MPSNETSPDEMSSLEQEMSAVFDAHVGAEFDTMDLEATMATMSDHPHLTHVPVLTGGDGREEIARFYGSHFIGHWPKDTTVTPLSRTVGQGRVVDEFVLSFTHDRPMPAIVPGIAPTGRKVEIPFIVIMGIEAGKVTYEHIYWDQASMLVQLGVLERGTLPVSGAEQARRLLDPNVPTNALIPKG